MEAQFVPGTNPVCPGDIPGTKGGRKSLCVKNLCAFFVPYTHIFIIWEFNSGLLLHMALWQEFFGVIRAPTKVLSVNAHI